jgi:hypothetical protein
MADYSGLYVGFVRRPPKSEPLFETCMAGSLYIVEHHTGRRLINNEGVYSVRKD